MCGRFALSISPELLAAFFQLDSVPAALDPHYNIAPGQQVSAIRLTRQGTRRLSQLRWGLVPHWAQHARGGARMINARRETLAEKPAFRDAFGRRRCLIPVSGFYEWQKRDQGPRQPHYIARRDGLPLALAALWERWKDPAGSPGQPAMDSCTIITTPAEDPLLVIHDRAPAVVPEAAWATWLDRDIGDKDLLQAMLQHPRDLEVVAVDPRVNTPTCDDAGCILPLEAPR